MITLSRLQSLANQLAISKSVVLLEYYQLLILKELSETKLGKILVFKGGTCLRLAYGSYRFSEDLDFSLLAELDFAYFKQQITQIVNRYSEVSIKETFDMKQTLFAKLIVAQHGIRVGIKLEISKRIKPLIKNQDYSPKILQAPTSDTKPLLLCFTLDKIYSDKLDAIKNRSKPRDYFDLWYLSQVLGETWQAPKVKDKKLMYDRVRFLLPAHKRFILEEFEYEKN